jgi:hypothetical protein
MLHTGLSLIGLDYLLVMDEQTSVIVEPYKCKLTITVIQASTSFSNGITTQTLLFQLTQLR